MSDKANLLDKMRNKWAAFFMEELPEFSTAMQVAPEHAACPVHGGKDGFRFFHDWSVTGGGVCNTCGSFGNGIRLYAWAKGVAAEKAEADIRAWLDIPYKVIAETTLEEVRVDYSARKRRLDAVWNQAYPIAEGTPPMMYLKNRGLGGIMASDLDPNHVRWHPSLEAQDRDGVSRGYPTLLLRLSQPNGELGSLHRIFLTARGQKAPLDEVKRMMPGASKLRGGAIRLFPAGPEIMLAEGVETAWAGFLLSKRRIPVWAGATAALLRSIQLPEETKVVHILADKDANSAGLNAAEKLRETLEREGRDVRVHIPPLDIPAGGHKVDWLDVLNSMQE